MSGCVRGKRCKQARQWIALARYQHQAGGNWQEDQGFLSWLWDTGVTAGRNALNWGLENTDLIFDLYRWWLQHQLGVPPDPLFQLPPDILPNDGEFRTLAPQVSNINQLGSPASSVTGGALASIPLPQQFIQPLPAATPTPAPQPSPAGPRGFLEGNVFRVNQAYLNSIDDNSRRNIISNLSEAGNPDLPQSHYSRQSVHNWSADVLARQWQRAIERGAIAINL